MSSLPKDLVAALATPLILSLLKRGDSYGYDIIQQVRDLSDGQLQWADGMLYPILHRLEKRQLIEAYWVQADTGRRRKYYRLKPAGENELQQQYDNWRQMYLLLQKMEGEDNV